MSELETELLGSDINTPKFSLNNNIYIAKCVKCYDADTIHVVFKLHNKLQRFTCRLSEVDTAELRSSNGDEKSHAIKGRDFLKTLILDKLIIIKCGKFDKYGRLLIYIYHYKKIINLGELQFMNSINNLLIKEKWGYQYYGGSKLNFTDWYKV